MNAQPLAILTSGMVTGVGLTAAATCAAIRCAISNFAETRFMDKGGAWILGSEVHFAKPWRGLFKLIKMVVPAIRECLTHVELIPPERIAMFLCVAENDRPGRLEGLDDQLLEAIQMELGVRFHSHSCVIARGRVGGAIAMVKARRLIHEEGLPLCLIAGVDTFLVATTLAAYEDRNRLLTSQNSNGFIPGEAGAAILVGPSGRGQNAELVCTGIGIGKENATIDSDSPLRANGMVQALKGALFEAGCVIGDLDFRITDSNGEQYWFKEATLALDKVLRDRKELFEIWHPADCIGETGSAIGPCALGLALGAARRNYCFGRGPLCHFSAEDSERLALVLEFKEKVNH